MTELIYLMATVGEDDEIEITEINDECKMHMGRTTIYIPLKRVSDFITQLQLINGDLPTPCNCCDKPKIKVNCDGCEDK